MGRSEEGTPVRMGWYPPFWSVFSTKNPPEGFTSIIEILSRLGLSGSGDAAECLVGDVAL
jgi:hypothetical protein